MPMTRREQLTEHLRFFEELGVAGVSRDPGWRRRAAATPDSAVSTPSGDAAEVPGADRATAADTLDEIRNDLGECTRCTLHAGRTTLVFGVGNPDADLVFVGEAPGRDEDLQGVPFVGRAGQLLTKIIASIGLTRDEVYIANVVKCRPPGNRNPEPAEVQTCEPFLFRQLDVIRPKVVVALGAFAIHTLLGTDQAISRLRGHVYEYRGAKLVPTFHPAFLLRSPGPKTGRLGGHEEGPRPFGRPVKNTLRCLPLPLGAGRGEGHRPVRAAGTGLAVPSAMWTHP